jgi:uncharacterized damage-inducible protein DinB
VQLVKLIVALVAPRLRYDQAVMSDLRYPVGKFSYAGPLSAEQKKQSLDDIEQTPAYLRAAVRVLSEAQLDTPYRDGGWTVRQVVHHVPDSHLNAYVRFKLALTEDDPTIKPYREDRWAELPDSRQPIENSLVLLESLHRRWMVLLRSLTEEEWKKPFRHPELGLMTLEKTLALYAWHGKHHVAHITSLRERMGW